MKGSKRRICCSAYPTSEAYTQYTRWRWLCPCATTFT